jgi:hypothetical protein
MAKIQDIFGRAIVDLDFPLAAGYRGIVSDVERSSRATGAFSVSIARTQVEPAGSLQS